MSVGFLFNALLFFSLNRSKTVDGEVFNFCLECPSFKSKGFNVTNCRNHLLKHKGKFAEFALQETEYKGKKNSDKKTPSAGIKAYLVSSSPVQASTSSDSVTPAKPYEKGSQKYKALKRKLTAVAACTTISQNALQSEEFKEYIAENDPRGAASIPSRFTLSKWVIEFNEDLVKAVVDLLKGSKKFSLSGDIWSDPGFSSGYLGVTAHFFNYAREQFQAVALACRSIPQPHTGDNIRRALEDILTQWDLKDADVLRYVTDQGSNMIKGLRAYKVLFAVPREMQDESDEEFEAEESSEDEDGWDDDGSMSLSDSSSKWKTLYY